jgi:ubiquinone/menaquinone biosynthesis C-methylase UbiE
MNLDRIYEYRFKDIDTAQKQVVWKEIARFMFRKLNSPEKILDPAAGLCEFINNIPSAERWAVDLNEEFLNAHANADVKKVIGNSLSVQLPENYFDSVFISNFLEHLSSQEEVAAFLSRMHQCLKPGGSIAVMGPNFKYAAREYFDFADHNVVLSELGLAEHIYAAGFAIKEIHGRFLPLSFRSNSFLPVNRFTVSAYLNVPFAWKLMGKQFLVIGKK